MKPKNTPYYSVHFLVFFVSVKAKQYTATVRFFPLCSRLGGDFKFLRPPQKTRQKTGTSACHNTLGNARNERETEIVSVKQRFDIILLEWLAGQTGIFRFTLNVYWFSTFQHYSFHFFETNKNCTRNTNTQTSGEPSHLFISLSRPFSVKP